MPPAIETLSLSRTFGPIQALDQVSLSVPKGIVFGFLGPNGSGKTTMIHLLLGLLEPSGGSAHVLGLDTLKDGDAVRQRCGALLEHAGLYERMTGADNLDLYGRIWRMPAEQRAKRSQELLERFGLWERRNERIDDWSRGMKQKLAVARAMLHRPELIFLDEPTAGLDPVAAAGLRRDLVQAADDTGVTVFVTTHNLAEAEAMCGMVGVIRQGRLLAMDHPDNLRKRDGSQVVQVFGGGLSGELIPKLQAQANVVGASLQNGHLEVVLQAGAAFAPLTRLLVALGVEIEEIKRGQQSLEMAFLALMEDQDAD